MRASCRATARRNTEGASANLAFFRPKPPVSSETERNTSSTETRDSLALLTSAEASSPEIASSPRIASASKAPTNNAAALSARSGGKGLFFLKNSPTSSTFSCVRKRRDTICCACSLVRASKEMRRDLDRIVAMTVARRDAVRTNRTDSGGSSSILSIALRALSLAVSAFCRMIVFLFPAGVSEAHAAIFRTINIGMPSGTRDSRLSAVSTMRFAVSPSFWVWPEASMLLMS